LIIGAFAFLMYGFSQPVTGNDPILIDGVMVMLVFGSFALLLAYIVQFLEGQRASRLGPSRDVGRAAIGELTMRIWAGVACNFVAPIGVGLCPWAVGSVSYGEAQHAYTLYVTGIVEGSVALFFIAYFTHVISFSEMNARAEFMIRVARLAQRSAMLDVAERCLRDCLELCARYGGTFHALEANARLVALLVQSGRMAEAMPHESAVRNVCATQLTGWRAFLRKYVAYGAPRSLTKIALMKTIDGELSFLVEDDDDMADLGAAYAMARLHAGLQHADAAVAELTKACDMRLAEDGVDNDELFEVVRLQMPEEFAVLHARIAENRRKRIVARSDRRMLLLLIAFGLVCSYMMAAVVL
jgi:hypothetical protein